VEDLLDRRTLLGLEDLFESSARCLEDRNKDLVSVNARDDSDSAGRIFIHLQYHLDQVTLASIFVNFIERLALTATFKLKTVPLELQDSL
jgi:hypothetical protein